MARQNIALMGRARSGKDTVAARLVEAHGYTRVAFADPLKDVAYELNPIISGAGFYGSVPIRLQSVIDRRGWEWAKDHYSEVRRLLQHLGQSVRDRSSGFWIQQALITISEASGPVVVTDCRYPNEAAVLKRMGFRMVRVIRPHHTDGTPEHESETALDGYPADVELTNGGTLGYLRVRADLL
jgi:hypothetical protein